MKLLAQFLEHVLSLLDVVAVVRRLLKLLECFLAPILDVVYLVHHQLHFHHLLLLFLPVTARVRSFALEELLQVLHFFRVFHEHIDFCFYLLVFGCVLGFVARLEGLLIRIW